MCESANGDCFFVVDDVVVAEVAPDDVLGLEVSDCASDLDHQFHDLVHGVILAHAL